MDSRIFSIYSEISTQNEAPPAARSQIDRSSLQLFSVVKSSSRGSFEFQIRFRPERKGKKESTRQAASSAFGYPDPDIEQPDIYSQIFSERR